MKYDRKEVMQLAWQFVKRNGFTLKEALQVAWCNLKLVKEFENKIVKFYFRKVDGTVREAYGTLMKDVVPPVRGTEKKKNDTVQVFFDTEKTEWRSFKKANLLSIA